MIGFFQTPVRTIDSATRRKKEQAMFGKKKSDDKPSPAKQPSKASGKKFDPKQFMLSHVEKFVFGLIALIAIGLIYLGATTDSFDSDKNPENLTQKSQDAVRKIGEDHWSAIKNQEARVKGITDVSYAAKAVQATQPMATVVIGIDPGDPSRIRERRMDPEILPARQLEAKYFFGPYVISSSNPQTVAIAEILDQLPDAKNKEDTQKKEPTKSGFGKGGTKSSGKFGGTQSGKNATPQLGTVVGSKKFLAAGYDRGFPSHTLAPPADKRKVLVARDLGFVAVTALAPHEDLEAEYRNKLAKAGNVLPGRDTPNYVGFEVQRVDVTDAPEKQILESDWQPLPSAGSEAFREKAKTTWLGTNAEVVAAEWTTQNLTMPIPPVLLKDYTPYVTHSEVPKLNDPTATSTGMGGTATQSQQYGNNGKSDSDSGTGSLGGFGKSDAGDGGAAGPGGKFGGKSQASGSQTGSKFGGLSGSGSSSDGSATTVVRPPDQLPSTKYKMVRFFDFDAKTNRSYRYRVRLLMYDPNFPEAASVQPSSSSLDVASGTLKRVQELLDKERKANESVSDKDGAKPYVRKSSRATAWSEPSSPIATVRTSEGFLGEPKLFYTADKESRTYEASPPRADMVIAEWDSKMAIFVPRKDSVTRGYIFGLPNSGKDAAFEIIHPITKYIKNLVESKVKSFVTVIDLSGLQNLEIKPPKDAHLKSGARGVAYDPEANRIIVMREFDDFTGYGMHAAPEKTAVGPLGGQLKSDGGGGFGGVGGSAAPGSSSGKGKSKMGSLGGLGDAGGFGSDAGEN
jgi:hypothetical protein